MCARNCHDPAVFGHVGGCMLAGWRARTHSYVVCDCDTCTARRDHERAEFALAMQDARWAQSVLL